MKNKIDVSIVIPAYNAENTIIECVNRILKIHKYYIEIIIIDDGSIDRTNEICHSISDERVKVFCKQNGGVSSARNMGLEEANGEYMLFCDADDYVQAEQLENVIDKIKEKKYDFIMYNVAKCNHGNIITEKMKIEQGEYSSEDGKILQKYLLDVPIYKKWKNNILQGSVWRYLYRVNFLKKNNIRFDENIAYGEDLCFCVEAFEKVQKFYVIDAVAYIVNIIPGTASRCFRSDFWETLKNVYARIVDITKKENNVLYCHYGRRAIIHYLLNQPFKNGIELSENVLNDKRFVGELKKITFNEKTWEEQLMDMGCIKKSRAILFIWSEYQKIYFLILSFLVKIKRMVIY